MRERDVERDTSASADDLRPVARKAWLGASAPLVRVGAGLLALAVVCASALVFAARWWWIGELAASFAWFVGGAALAAAAALFALRSRRLAWLCAALGALHVWPEARLWLPEPRATTAGASLRIASANVLHPNRHHVEIARALRELDADVIAVEELSRPLLDVLESELAAWPHRVVSPPLPWNDRTWALGLFSRLPLTDVRLVQLRENYAPSIEARVECEGATITLRVVHLPRPGKAWRVDARNAALDELATLFEWDGCGVLLGDLNTTSSSPRFPRLLERTGLRDSRRGFGRQPTYALRRLPAAPSIAIDHVLVGAGLEVLERATFAVPHSDHDGVVVRLSPRAASRRP